MADLVPPTSLFPVIVGPTAGGKTTLAVEVALALAPFGGGEVVTADSIQIYRGLDIGAAKPTPHERRGVPHHLIDIVDPTDEFTVHDWLHAAESVIADIQSRSRIPVVVGGTHLYIKSFIDGMFDGPGGDGALREQLRARGLPTLRQELERVDPAAASRIHANDERRTVRALEVFLLSGKTISDHQQQWDRDERRRKDCILVGLDWSTEAINRRINARVRLMIEHGLVDECRSLYNDRQFGLQSREALGYKQLIEHFEGRRVLDEAIEEIKIQTRRFAKSQRTWLKRLRLTPGSLWINADESAAGTWAAQVMAKLNPQP